MPLWFLVGLLSMIAQGRFIVISTGDPHFLHAEKSADSGRLFATKEKILVLAEHWRRDPTTRPAKARWFNLWGASKTSST